MGREEHCGLHVAERFRVRCPQVEFHVRGRARLGSRRKSSPCAASAIRLWKPRWRRDLFVRRQVPGHLSLSSSEGIATPLFIDIFRTTGQRVSRTSLPALAVGTTRIGLGRPLPSGVHLFRIWQPGGPMTPRPQDRSRFLDRHDDPPAPFAPSPKGRSPGCLDKFRFPAILPHLSAGFTHLTLKPNRSNDVLSWISIPLSSPGATESAVSRQPSAQK